MSPTPSATHSAPCAMSQACGMLCVASLDGYFKQLNPAWAERLGWTLAELQSRPFVHFVHPHDRAATLAELAKLNGGADTVAFENRYAHRDGSYRWLQWTAKPVPGRSLVQAAARDVTDQRRLEKEIVEISDREKDRLGRDLHDGLCQNLAGIAALSTTLSRQLTSLNAPASAAAAEIAQLLNQAVAQARDLARGLNPVELDGIGLIGALDTLTRNIGSLFRKSCIFCCNQPTVSFPPEVQTHLYRIAQEAVQNAVKHGRAGRIAVTLRIGNGQGTLAIRDNGVGISADSGYGNGMHTMNYRARLIGASLWVQRHRRGTRVVCVFGLPSDPEGDESDV